MPWFREHPTGLDLVACAESRVGDPYVLGATVDYFNPDEHGPFDCAELLPWVIYQVTGRFAGTTTNDVKKPGQGFTGYFVRDARAQNPRAKLADAVNIPGAILIRAPNEGVGGHVALVGRTAGSTIEAYDSARGVIRGTSANRTWTDALLLPGVVYSAPLYSPRVLKLTRPRMRGPDVAAVQGVVGIAQDARDGVFGPDTAKAVVAWQAAHGLVPDGEVGPRTCAAMGLG